MIYKEHIRDNTMKPYVLDDTFTISDEIKKMSNEERQQLARKLEEEGKRETYGKWK